MLTLERGPASTQREGPRRRAGALSAGATSTSEVDAPSTAGSAFEASRRGAPPNDKLSEQRGELVHAVLVGDRESRDTFAKIADDTAKVEDWQQILKWTAAAFPAIEELVDEEEGSTAAESDSDGGDDSGGGEPEDGKLGTGFGEADPGDIDGDKQRTEPFVLAFQNA